MISKTTAFRAGVIADKVPGSAELHQRADAASVGLVAPREKPISAKFVPCE